jgi:hypothetical protein
MFKKRELLRKTNYNFIKIDLNFPAYLASPSFELATLGIERKTLNPTTTEAYTIKKLKIAYLYRKCSQKSQITKVTRLCELFRRTKFPKMRQFVAFYPSVYRGLHMIAKATFSGWPKNPRPRQIYYLFNGIVGNGRPLKKASRPDMQKMQNKSAWLAQLKSVVGKILKSSICACFSPSLTSFAFS